jgi:hypothetical protein
MRSIAQPRSQAPRSGGLVHDRILSTARADDLSFILLSDVLAVIASLQPEAWIEELSTAVGNGSFVVNRSIQDGVSISGIARFLSEVSNASSLASSVRTALCDDVLGLATTCADLTGATRFRFRFFTDIPNTRCSYHVDVVPPGSPKTALIRVYCGARTEYVEPSNVVSWEDFYAWEFLRKRQVQAVAEAQARNDAAAEERAKSRLARLDAKPHFLVQAENVCTVPPHALVACKFVDGKHLLDRTHVQARSARGWIHRSPMTGAPRCVATVNAIN